MRGCVGCGRYPGDVAGRPSEVRGEADNAERDTTVNDCVDNDNLVAVLGRQKEDFTAKCCQ